VAQDCVLRVLLCFAIAGKILHARVAEHGSRIGEAAVLPGQCGDDLPMQFACPGVPAKDCRRDEAAAGDLEHRAPLMRPGSCCRAEEVAVGVGDQARLRLRAIGAIRLGAEVV